MYDTLFMKRCLQLALLGKSQVAPNPMVGAVLVYNNKIIGEGYHRKYGLAHAEVNCFDSVANENKPLIPKSVLYVNLEPCNHFGKTPPCSHRIVKEGVKKVVIANQDPFKKVDGMGIKHLEDNGVEVVTNVESQEAYWLNRRFFIFHEKKRPYIILKWAQTKSNIFAPTDKSRFQLTDVYSNSLNQQWRNDEAAIMVATTTAINDNPVLLSKLPNVLKQPLRIVIDKHLKIPQSHHLLQPSEHATWAFNHHKSQSIGALSFIQLDVDKDIISQILDYLYTHNINSVIVEGGATLLNSFISLNLWDESRVFITPNVLSKGIEAPHINPLYLKTTFNLNNDELNFYVNEHLKVSSLKEQLLY